MQTFTERLQYCADAKGVLQSQVAADLGFGAGTVSRYFSGESTPKSHELLRLAQYFSVSMEWLLLGDEARSQTALRVSEEDLPYEVNKRISERELGDILTEVDQIGNRIREIKKKLEASPTRKKSGK